MKHQPSSEKAFIDCLWHANQIVILEEWLHAELKWKLAQVNKAKKVELSLALSADLRRVREHLKRAFRKLTRIRLERLEQVLAVESCNDELSGDRLRRLENVLTWPEGSRLS